MLASAAFGKAESASGKGAGTILMYQRAAMLQDVSGAVQAVRET